MTAHARASRAPLQGFLLGLLLCACLVAQTLGLVHRVAHGLPGERLALQAALPSTAATPLFTVHAHAADCLLYDHQGIADLLLGLPLLAPPALFAPLVSAVLQAGVAARVALAFQARAPPSLR